MKILTREEYEWLAWLLPDNYEGDRLRDKLKKVTK